MPSGPSAGVRGMRRSQCSPWRLASGRTPRSSVSSTASCSGLCRMRPEQLVTISSQIAQTQAGFPSLPVRAVDFLEIRRSSRELSELSAVSRAEFSLTGTGEPERLYGARVSSNFFSMVGIQPALGRAFTPEEDELGRDQVAILSHELSVTRFGGDPSIVGRPVSLNGQPFTVLGVMPRGFLFPVGRQLHQYVPLGPRVDIWKPMAFSKAEATSEGSWNYGVIARIRSGANLFAAQEELNAIAGAISERFAGATRRAGHPPGLASERPCARVHDISRADHRPGHRFHPCARDPPPRPVR
jgi:hypothetical protein